jgi:hypothetical protein
VWKGSLFAVYVGSVGDGGGLCVVEQLVSIQYEKCRPFLGMGTSCQFASLLKLSRSGRAGVDWWWTTMVVGM